MTDLLTGWSTEGPALWHLTEDLEWHDDIDEELVCTEVTQVTHDVKSFVLQPAYPGLFRFQPGQYLTLTVTVDGQQLNRCYTIASSPSSPDSVTITVKRSPGGPVSNWLHDTLRPGDTVPVTGPLGAFSIDQHARGKYLFLSAGSGITPLMSMTRAIRDRGQDADVVFVHHARTPADIVFRDELAEIADSSPGIRVVTVCTRDSADDGWTGLRGRLTLSMLHAIAPDLTDREVFSCGPRPYLEAVRAILVDARVDDRRRHEESFTFPGTVPPPPAASDRQLPPDAGDLCPPKIVQGFSVEFSRSGRTVTCDGATTLLAAAASSGLGLPSSCGEGVCGTCKATMLSGSVEMDHAGGIRPREIAQNKILLCCSTPSEDLVIDA